MHSVNERYIPIQSSRLAKRSLEVAHGIFAYVERRRNIRAGMSSPELKVAGLRPITG
jgi:hypothetical protein